MKRNSFTIWVESSNAVTPVPWVDGAPDFSGITEPTLSVLQAAYEANKDNIVVIPDPVPVPPPVPKPDWDTLTSRCLGGDLHPIFQRLTIASLADNAISTVAGHITDAILTVRVEAALASGFALLNEYTPYRFTEDQTVGGVLIEGEKTLWNRTVTELNFTPLVFLL